MYMFMYSLCPREESSINEIIFKISPIVFELYPYRFPILQYHINVWIQENHQQKAQINVSQSEVLLFTHDCQVALSIVSDNA